MSDAWPSDVEWESIEAHFAPPPELKQPSPRRAVPRNGEESGCSGRAERSCLSGCLLPIFLLGVLLVFWGGLAALMLPLGQATTGTVTRRERGDGSASTYSLAFRFQVNSYVYESEGQVPTEKWKRARVGDSVRVRYFPFAPALRPLLADDFSPWRSIFGLGMLGLVMLVISALPLSGLVTMHRDKKLVSYGVMTPAFVIKRDERKDSITFVIRDENGRQWEVETPVGVNQPYRAIKIETALYLPDKPTSARLYFSLEWKGRLP